MPKCCTRWNMDTGCRHLRAAHLSSTTSCLSAGWRTPWSDPPLRPCSGSLRTSTPSQTLSTGMPRDPNRIEKATSIKNSSSKKRKTSTKVLTTEKKKVIFVQRTVFCKLFYVRIATHLHIFIPCILQEQPWRTLIYTTYQERRRMLQYFQFTVRTAVIKKLLDAFAMIDCAAAYTTLLWLLYHTPWNDYLN